MSEPAPQDRASVGAATYEPLIVLDSVDKWFGELHVLVDINLTVGKGEVVVVIGPSGSGKSTLCRTINRLETIDKGTISLDGALLPEEGKALAALRAEVGMVFQSFNLFAHKTILENVTLGPIKVRGKSKSEADKRGRELLERVGCGRAGREVPSPAVRGAAATSGDRPGTGDGAQGDAVRRADLGTGPRDDQRGPRGDGRTSRGGG